MRGTIILALLLIVLGLIAITYWDWSRGGERTGTSTSTYPNHTYGQTTTGWMMSSWKLGHLSEISFPQVKVEYIELKKFPLAQNLPMKESDLLNPRLISELGIDGSKEKLLNDGFVLVKWGRYSDFSKAYSALKRYPIYVTVDSFLHAYHVQFDSILADIEEKYLFHDLYNLTSIMLERSSSDVLKAGEPGLKNLAYFSVAMKLLDPSFSPPDEVKGLVEAEIKLIDEGKMANSTIFGYMEDYSQYRPRGHYTRSEKLERYFRAMMWYGRMAFLMSKGLVSEERSRELTVQASLIAAHLSSDSNASKYWERIYAVTSFFVGFADDYTPYDYLEVLKSLFGGSLSLEELNSIKKDDVILRFRHELLKRGKPKIYGGTGACEVTPPITEEKLEKCLEKSAGMRFMGQRYVPDSYVFQRLVAPSVGLFKGSGRPFTLVYTQLGPARGFPRGLDWFAVIGSDRALSIIREEGDASYEGYEDRLKELREEFSSVDWSRNLYWSWLDVLRLLVSERGEEYPPYMRSEAWLDRQLQAALASWTELRHDTILYAKQSYTPKLTAAPPPAELGAVEPLPQVYQRLESLVNQTMRGLEEMGYLSQEAKARLEVLARALRTAKEISVKELNGEPLNESDLYFIGNFADVMDSIMTGLDERAKSTVLVADVHTDLNSGEVLEEAVGKLDLIVVAFPTPNGTALMVGPVLSYYEFRHPMTDRLTDEKWSEMLDNPPKQFPWQERLYYGG